MLAPCGVFGRRYRYDASLARRLAFLNNLLCWIGAGACAILFSAIIRAAWRRLTQSRRFA
jgi:hypothetical protein